MKAATLFIMILCACISLFGQATPGTLWTQFYDRAEAYVQLWGINRASDAGFIMAGREWVGSPIGYHPLVYRTNQDGEVQWFYYDETSASSLWHIETIPDGYVACGNELLGSAQLLKLSDEGDLLWNQFYSSTGLAAYALGLQVVADGFIAAGSVQCEPQFGQTPYYFKTNRDGTLIWQRDFCGFNYGGQLRAVHQLPNGDYVFAGWRYESYPNQRGFVFRTDQGGDIVWQITYGGALDASFHDMAVNTVNNSLIMTGWIETALGWDLLLLSTDFDGNQLWQLNWGVENGYVKGFAIDFDPAIPFDGEYAVTGEIVYGYLDGDAFLLKAKDLETSGVVTWSHILPHVNEETPASYGYDIERVSSREFAVTGYTWNGDLDHLGMLSYIVGPLETPKPVIYRDDQQNGVNIQWNAVPSANTYVIEEADASDGEYSVLQSTSLTGTWVETLESQKFYRVSALYGSARSDYSNVIGYAKITVLGTPGGIVYTPFGLPFQFWETANGIPNYGVESTSPTDICRDQPNCGTFGTADFVWSQNTSYTARRLSNINCTWSGPLVMAPGHAYWYGNRTGVNRTLVLAGQVNNNGDYLSLTIMSPQNWQEPTYTPYSWRDSRSRAIWDLNLIEDGFLGGNIANSDAIMDQMSGESAWYSNQDCSEDDCWRGTLTSITPGRAYWIVNKHPGNTWVYSYDGN